MTRQEMEAQLAALQARAEQAEARAQAAEAATASKPRYSGITLKVSEQAKCLSIYGLQSRPVTLYASQFVKVLAVHADEIKAFILANADTLAWKTADEKHAALAMLRPVVVAPVTPEATPAA